MVCGCCGAVDGGTSGAVVFAETGNGVGIGGLVSENGSALVGRDGWSHDLRIALGCPSGRCGEAVSVTPQSTAAT